MLTVPQIKNAPLKAKPYKKADGLGLTLLVQPDGGKFWRFRYRYAGKEQMLSLGAWPDVSLAEARQLRDEARARLRTGVNPASLRKQVKAQAVVAAANTFRAVAAEWIELHRGSWRPSHTTRVQSQLDRDILPALGDRPIGEISPHEVLVVAKQVEARDALDQAKRCLQRMTAIFALGVRSLRCDSNPARELAGVIKTRRVKHHAALPFDQVPDYLDSLEKVGAGPEARGAMELLILTAARSGEVRGMRWPEVDMRADLWRIPGERTKTGMEHLVPLSRQAMAVLERAQSLSGGGELVFPSPSKPKEPLTANALLMIVRRMGYQPGEVTPHGFRATFSTTMNELGHNPDVIERVLAHVPADKIRAAYHRAQYLEERRVLLQTWADMIDGNRSGANVVPLRRRAKA
ncbi:integrase [Dyella lipolytica]|uniref:Tyrosine-type recombinase/integrase n=1 Tax=Dyella lipolytica TaxID=1867835 RepID=A0ABW8J0D1_9GAMM|nr:tyrosine-type recombinase/integrase [Dyella lipolytica]GLQ45651.1 integrase [Dyella lipolytica]